MHCTVAQLCLKDVVCVDNAARVGTVTDVEIDMATGEMVCLCVTPFGGLFRPRPPVKICRQDIVMVGAETVLVRNVPAPPPPGGKKRPFGFLFNK